MSTWRMNWTFKQIDSLKVLPSLEKLSLGDNNGDTDLRGEKGIEGVGDGDDDLFRIYKNIEIPYLSIKLNRIF